MIDIIAFLFIDIYDGSRSCVFMLIRETYNININALLDVKIFTHVKIFTRSINRRNVKILEAANQ